MKLTASCSRGALLLAATLLVGACGGGVKNDPILRLSATESLEEGQKLLEEGSYRQARKYLIHAFEVEPNSVAWREGLLLAADALYAQDRYDSYVEAEGRYRDFLNRFPTSQRADYAQFRMASCLAQRVEKPNRDQETTRKAISSFEELIRIYPTSEWTDEARLEMARIRNFLAEHEFVVGKFYYNRSGQKRAVALARGAINRFEYLLENYPEYDQVDKILGHLCVAHSRLEEIENARTTCSRLEQEFPDSKYREMIPKDLRGGRQRNAGQAVAGDAQGAEQSDEG